jgi:hypothetical protein
MRAQDRKIVRWISEHGRTLGQGRVMPQSKEIELPDAGTRKRDIENGSHVAHSSPLQNLSIRQLFIVVLAAILVAWHLIEWYRAETGVGEVETCPQVVSLAPSRHADLLKGLESLYATDLFKTDAYAGLSGAVQIP